MSECLNGEQIEQSFDSRIINVSVPEWGGHVFLKTISSYDCDQYQASINDGKKQNLANLRARLVALCLCDEDGNLVFESQPKGASIIGKKNSLVVRRLFDICRQINGMTDDDVEEKKGNSNGDQRSSLPSD